MTVFVVPTRYKRLIINLLHGKVALFFSANNIVVKSERQLRNKKRRLDGIFEVNWLSTPELIGVKDPTSAPAVDFWLPKDAQVTILNATYVIYSEELPGVEVYDCRR